MIEDDREFCLTCLRETAWRKSRCNARHLTCKGCGDVFPCRHACTHLDCIDTRKGKAKCTVKGCRAEATTPLGGVGFCNAHAAVARGEGIGA